MAVLNRPGPAIHLAAVPDFSIGAMQVQPSLRRISFDERAESVEPRVMQALIALFEAREAVVSRDALIDRCWGGRIVGEDAINRCIAKVRRLSEATDPPAFAIETISKVGYRLKIGRDVLLAPQTFPASPPRTAEPTPVPALSPPGLARRPRWPLPVTLVIAILGGVGVWRVQPRSHWAVQSGLRLLPNLALQTFPHLSPDGTMVSYIIEPDAGPGRLYVGALHSGIAHPVSLPAENARASSWASDSAHLAYIVVGQPGAPCRIMVTAVPGGTPHQAGRCRHLTSTELSWQPGTASLFLADEAPAPDGQATSFRGAIFRLDSRTGRSEPVTSPPPNWNDYDGHISPDGKSLAYVRDGGLFGGRTLRVRNLATRQERQLKCDPDLEYIEWAPDSRTVLASVPGQLGDEILAYPTDGARPYRVYASATGLGRLSIGPNGMLAVEVVEKRSNLARAYTTSHTDPTIIDPAAGWTDWPAFAPDGTLAFVSDRSGKIAVWTQKPGGQPVELPNSGLKDIERPVWSPDGGRIAFLEAWKGKLTVHVVTAQGASIAAFSDPSIAYALPNWSDDGERLLMFDRRLRQVVLIDPRDPSRHQPVGGRPGEPTIYHDGATYASNVLTPDLWLARGGAPNPPNFPIGRYARLAFSGNDVLLPDSKYEGDRRILAQPMNGGPARVAFYAPAAEAETPFAVDPRTHDVIYVNGETEDHIDLLTIARQ